jgi:biotin-(acetyl-CoA carboxylase) ligase
MQILSECPGSCEALKGEASWQAAGVGRLPERLQSWWSTLSDRDHPSLAPASGEMASCGLDALLVIDHASCSQFSAILDALQQGVSLCPGVAALALEGERFRGLRDRSWAAVRGNIHLCILFAPQREVTHFGAGLTMLPTVAVMDTLRALGTVESVGIKWVNDVLVHGKKVAGALTSTRMAGHVVEHALFGIGLNVASVPDVEPTRFVNGAGSLAGALGAPMEWHAPLSNLLTQLMRRYRELMEAGPGPLLEAYRADSIIIGQRVRIWPEEADRELQPRHLLAEGVVEGIEADLSLRLEGHGTPISAGRLELVHDSEGC